MEIIKVFFDMLNDSSIEHVIIIALGAFAYILYKRNEKIKDDMTTKCSEMMTKYEVLLEKATNAIQQMSTMRNIEEAIRNLRRDKE
jgi:hypothetical protein